MGWFERLDNTIFPDTNGWKALIYMVPAVGIEPTRPQGTRDFEFFSSTMHTSELMYVAEAQAYVKIVVDRVLSSVENKTLLSQCEEGRELVEFAESYSPDVLKEYALKSWPSYQAKMLGLDLPAEMIEIELAYPLKAA